VQSGSRRGFASSKDCANLHSSRLVRARELLRKQSFFGSKSALLLVSPCLPREGAAEGKGRQEGRHLLQPNTRNRCARGKCPYVARIAEVARTSSRPKKRATGLRTGRKPGCLRGARVRGLSHDVPPSVRAQGAGRGEGETVGRSSADPHHVSAAQSIKARRFVRTLVRAGCAVPLATEGTSDRESARLSQGPRGTGLGGFEAKATMIATARLRAHERRGGDRGARDGHCDRARGEIKPSRRDL